MKAYKLLFNLVFIALLTSCSLGPEVPNGDYYNIEEIEADLVKKAPWMSSCLENNTNKVNTHIIELTDSIQFVSPIGIRLKLQGIGGANLNYGPYEKGGLIEKIKSLSIIAKGVNKSTDITGFLKGDSSINYYLLTKEAEKDFGDTANVCKDIDKAFYVPDIPSLIKEGNSYKPEEKNIFNINLFFWMSKEDFKKLAFKPKTIIVNIGFIAALGKAPRQLVDTIRLK